MKRFITVLTLLMGLLSYTSCTVLQWRNTDKEIDQKFNELQIKHRISYFNVDSLQLKTRILSVTKESNKINLVFFHGSPSSLSAWDSYLTDSILSKQVNMHAIDRPGYGYSNFGDEMTSINTQAQIMSALINEKKLQNVIAIGSSYGGPLAARLGLLNKNVKAIVMISPAIDPTIEKDVWGARLTQWKLTRWLTPTAYRVAGDEKTVHAKELETIKNDWKNITLPVLHIHGTIDDLVPYENIHFSKNNFQHITIVSIPEKGHEIAWKHKDLMMPHILKIINQIKKAN